MQGTAGTQGPKGDTGAQGPAGAQGAAGTQGPPGPSTGAAGGDLTGNYPNPLIANGAVTDAMVAAANKDGSASTPSLRTLGSGALQAMPGNATPGGPPTGSAGGALAGSYPNPTLDVSGGPCANGQALTDVSSLGALTCSPGVYSDANSNVAAGPSPFGALILSTNNNVAVGVSMLNHDTTGVNNTASGDSTLASNISGNNNTASGNVALFNNTSGGTNTASGVAALISNTSGDNNTASGGQALASNTTGGFNTADGVLALSSNDTGSSNTALGRDAGAQLTSGSNNIDIGEDQQGVADESNTIRIGVQGTQTATYLAGVFGTNPGAGAPVLAASNGQLGVNTSSRRFKTDIRPLRSALGRLMELNPVSFRYKPADVHGPNPTEFGLLAEQVAKVYPNLVVDGPDGKPYTVAYQELPALLLAEIQRQQRQIDQLKTQNRRINRLQAEVDSLMRHGGRS